MIRDFSGPVAVLALCVALLSGCVSRLSQQTIVLEYADFGPQAMAYRIIGKKRFPWAPDTPITIGEGTIYVVVYRNLEKTEVERAFPADQASNKDYRYVSYSDAIDYLDRNIALDILSRVTQRLEQSRRRILDQLGAG